ncbi:G-protein beta WD- 40 repeats containing protein [Penicillium manginii]|uniref:G-protein beta WD- 40 repeats containing protein n=1 Tax=Penicillium manginii TaxID=203109 RepID=UPI002547060B|nr:G-protein beta WD- 40 repeats containing protein [Penicillium manginii]KAJ5755383.1 G-protein beta WD- 40 repeats containing protein [Penicillium manginii]
MASNNFGHANRGLQIGVNNAPISTEIYQSYTIEDIDRFCMQNLACPDSFVVKNRLKAAKDKLHRQSWEWILQTPEYQSWMGDSEISLLWIKGGAGKGKTMMAIGLIEELSKQRENTVAYFFCQNADRELNTLESIIKGLILGLVNQNTELKASLRRRWDTQRERFTEDCTSWRNLWDILFEMLASQCKLSSVYLVVDALDECQDGGMAEFLRLIVRNGLDQPKLKWLLTSRPLDSAERALLTGHEQTQVSLELNFSSISQAVDAYISQKVDELSAFQRYKAPLKSEIRLELSKKAEGTFLWVSLVCKKLENVPQERALGTIQDLPPGLDALYDRALDQLRDSKTDDTKKCMRLLKAMMLVYRPLNVVEVSAVTGLADEDNEGLVNRCASFIRRQANKIEFVHQSTRDYLAEEKTQSIFQLYTSFGHHDILQGCLSQLSERLKVNLLDLPRPDSTRNPSEPLSQEETVKISCLDYAATFWVRHFENVDHAINQSETLENVRVFLYSKFLEWLEYLSLSGRLSLAPGFLETLGPLTKNDTSTAGFVRDAARFIPRHYHTMTHWPLQIYSSAIFFSPDSSIVRRKNLDKVPKYLRQVSPVEDRWPSVIQTLESQWTGIAAFSPDGKWVVSGDEMGKLTLWDSVGSPSKTWKGHRSEVLSVAFSPDGKRIVSGSKDHTIKLWSLTGALEKTLNGHSKPVLSVAFSPDGKRIVSGSGDHTIKLWSLTGALEKTLKGHSGRVQSVAFSPDGKRIVSGSDDHTIKLWSLTGALEKTLKGHSRKVCTVVFSPDGTRIASASWDNTSKLWDLIGGPEDTFQHPEFHAATFSPDIKRLALISGSSAINICKTADDSGEKINGHSNPRDVTGLEFSPNGKQIASGSGDGYITLWCAATGDRQRVFEHQSDRINLISFSFDGSYVISYDYRRISNYIVPTINIWNTETGESEKTIQQSPSLIQAISFLPDGKHFILSRYSEAFNDQAAIIEIWNITTGENRNIMRHPEHIIALAISPCGKYIASSSRISTINLWNIADFFKISKLRGRFFRRLLKPRHLECIETSEWVYSMRFSEDGQYLQTEYGAIMLKDAGLKPIILTSLYIHDQWIKYGDDIRCLRLPKDYDGRHWKAHGDQVAIGLDNGEVFVLNIRRSCVRSMLEQTLGMGV